MGHVAGSPIAHTGKDGAHHDLREHLDGVAARAGDFAAKWGKREYGRIAGLWHDLGKYSPEFQAYLAACIAADAAGAGDAHCEPINAEQPARGKVNHSSAGAILAARTFGAEGLPIAFAIAGHHAGLADLPKLRDRLQDRKLLDAAETAAPPSLLATPTRLEPWLTGKATGLLKRRSEAAIRMLFSALVDADFLDTAAFFDPTDPMVRGQGASLPDLLMRLEAFLGGLEAAAEERANGRPRAEALLQARRDVRDACTDAATFEAGDDAPRIFTLSVPTGGGKTFASLEFALRHAVAHNLDRVIIAIPFTSIVEQTALAYRAALGVPDDDATVLEHHASFDPDRETRATRLAAENWDAPIVVTTTVQLFESLFANRTSRCRKLHRIARSVVILDEAQTMPRDVLAATTEMLETLSRDFGATIVLATATQPALLQDSLTGFLPRTTAASERVGFTAAREICPPTLKLFERLRRVTVEWPPGMAPTPYAELAHDLAQRNDVLAIVHRRADARELVGHIDEKLGTTETFHLSALMHATHRTRVLAAIRERKRAGLPVRLIATQLVEAGVDLDFPEVYRALGGLDALAQAAGRCNREGRLEALGTLRVFVAPTKPPPGIAEQALETTKVLLNENPNLDLFDPAIYERYFQLLYGSGTVDLKSIQTLREEMSFAKVAEHYRVIDDDWSATVVVPDEAISSELSALRSGHGTRRIFRRLGRFSVNVPKGLLNRWLQEKLAETIQDSVHVLRSASAYSERFGLEVDRVAPAAPLELIL